MQTGQQIAMMRTIQLAIFLLASLTLGVAMTQADDTNKARDARVAAIEGMEQGLLAEAITQGKKKVDFQYRLFVPEGADAGRPLPLVVFLHGRGRIGTDNVGPMELAWPFVKDDAQAKHPCFVVAPQVPPGGSWGALRDERPKVMHSSEPYPMRDEMAAMLKLVDELVATRPIDANRVYLVGQSMGGYGAWDALMRRPGLWAAAVPVCGGGMPKLAAAFKDVPVWAWHGDADKVVPVDESRKMISAMKAAGGEPRYTEIPSGGHNAGATAFSDPELFDWLFSQTKASAPDQK